MKRLCILLMVLAVASLFSVNLSLDQAINMSFENNKLLKQSEIKVENAEKTRKSYRTNFLPKLSFSANYMLRENATDLTLDGGYLPTYSPDANGALQPNLLTDATGNPVIGSDGNPVFTSYAYMPDITAEVLPKSGLMAGLSLKQPIYMGGKINSAYNIAKIGKDISQLQFSMSKEQLIVDVTESYWRVLTVQENLATAREYNEMLTNLVADVENAVNSGLRTRNDLLKAQVKLNETKLMVEKAKHGLELSKMDLSQKIGSNTNDMALENIEIIPQLDIDTNPAIQNRRDYQVLAKSVQVSKKKIDIARADFLPQIGLSADYSYLEYELNDETSESVEYTILANLSVPIFQWFDSFYKVGVAKNEHNISELNFDHYKELMALEINKNKFAYQDAITAYNISLLSLEQAEENLRIVNDSFTAGRETLTELLDAQASWQKVKSQLTSAKMELEISKLKYKKSIGKLLTEK